MKRWSTIAGTAFAAVIMAVVLYLYGGDLRTVDFTNSAVVPRLSGAVALYVLVILIGASAWRVLLTALGAKPAKWAAERQLLVSQIGKYVPGNVAQYIGRAALAMTSGVPARTVGIALIAEAAATVIGGLLVVAGSIALAPQLADSVGHLVGDGGWMYWGIAGLTILLVAFFGASLGSSVFKRFDAPPMVGTGGVLLATFLYAISFLLLGLSLYLVTGLVSSGAVPVGLCVALFAAAWVSGLATPGAPGGLGVRESVLTLGLAPFVGGAAALSVALIHRGVSVFGDVLSFGLGLLMPKSGPK